MLLKVLFIFFSSSSNVNQPWTGPKKGSSRRQRKGVGNSTAPSPSYVVMAECRQGWTSWGRSWLREPLFCSARRICEMHSTTQTEGKNGKVGGGGGWGGRVNHCSCADGGNDSLMFWMRKAGRNICGIAAEADDTLKKITQPMQRKHRLATLVTLGVFTCTIIYSTTIQKMTAFLIWFLRI